jgi:hypothetical protein
MKIHTESDKTYGILLSGGLDSSILLYILLKNNSNIKIQPFTIPKKDGAYLYVDPIIDYFNKKFNTSIPETIKAGDPNAHHRKQNESAVRDVLEKFPIDQLFMAINRIPDELANYPGAPNRAKSSLDPRILIPFVDLTKDQILSIVFTEGLDDLIPLTHSCTEQQHGRCNVCWQCQERIWAFNKLEKQDTGVN